MASAKPDGVDLTREQEANLKRHLRYQKRERAREPDLQSGLKQAAPRALRRLDLTMNRILPAIAGLGIISWGLDFGSSDPAGGIIAIPAMFIGAVLILGAALGSRLISIVFWFLGGFSLLTWLFFGY